MVTHAIRSCLAQSHISRRALDESSPPGSRPHRRREPRLSAVAPSTNTRPGRSDTASGRTSRSGPQRGARRRGPGLRAILATHHRAERGPRSAFRRPRTRSPSPRLEPGSRRHGHQPRARVPARARMLTRAGDLAMCSVRSCPNARRRPRGTPSDTATAVAFPRPTTTPASRRLRELGTEPDGRRVRQRDRFRP